MKLLGIDLRTPTTRDLLEAAAFGIPLLALCLYARSSGWLVPELCFALAAGGTGGILARAIGISAIDQGARGFALLFAFVVLFVVTLIAFVNLAS